MKEIKERAFNILIALLQNPERYKYIAELVDSEKITQNDATSKNIRKALIMAIQFEIEWQSVIDDKYEMKLEELLQKLRYGKSTTIRHH